MADVLDEARDLAGPGAFVLPSHIAEASEAHHLRQHRPPEIARHYALLDALDYLFGQSTNPQTTPRGREP